MELSGHDGVLMTNKEQEEKMKKHLEEEVALEEYSDTEDEEETDEEDYETDEEDYETEEQDTDDEMQTANEVQKASEKVLSKVNMVEDDSQQQE